MPTLPARLARGAERLFGKPVTVTDVDQIGPRLRRVTFHAGQLTPLDWAADHEVEFRVGDGAFRHYSQTGRTAEGFSVIFSREAGGPGTSWAWNLQPGEETLVMGPGGGIRFAPSTTWWLLGDDTTIGLAESLLDASPGGRVVLEVATESVAAVSELLPHAQVIARDGAAEDPAGALGTVTRGELASASALPPDRVYLAGRAASIRPLRRLFAVHLNSGQISAKPFWAEGKRGL